MFVLATFPIRQLLAYLLLSSPPATFRVERLWTAILVLFAFKTLLIRVLSFCRRLLFSALPRRQFLAFPALRRLTVSTLVGRYMAPLFGDPLKK